MLDLAAFAGGLTPVRQVGSMQSIGLALQGRDGRSYTFRTTDKDPTRILPPEWAGTVPAKLFQDSTTANHPGVGFVVPPLAQAAGVLHATPRYVFMPDTPALGEFRTTFGGKPGTLEEYPQAAAGGRPGFAGAEEIVSTSEVWTRSLQGAGTRVDTRAVVRAGCSTWSSRTGIATTSSGAGCGSPARTVSSPSPRTATRPSRSSRACC